MGDGVDIDDDGGASHDFGRWVRVTRGSLPLTQEELAGQAGVSVRTIQMLESGRARARPATRRQIVEVLAGAGASTRPAERLPAREVPAQLPLGVRGFVGRTGALARLDALLADAAPETAVVIAALSGTAGVGKTALAVHWAHRVRDRFPDGQLYVNLRGFDPGGSPVSPSHAVRGFLDGFGVPPQRIPADEQAQFALYRSVLAGRRVLVVLDNARDAEQLRPLLPGAPGCVVLVTSRDQLAGLIAVEGAHPISLDLLTSAEAGDLLARRLGRARVAAEPQAAEEIIARCARLPLALTVAAARAATHPDFPLRALAGELGDSRGGLDAFDGGDEAVDVRAVFSWSYHTLSPAAARLFRLLGLHAGPDIGLPSAASLAGVPVGPARAALAELARAHLVNEHVPDRYTFHDLLRAYATELAEAVDAEAERRAALRRVLDHYLHTAHAAALRLEPHPYQIRLEPVRAGVVPEDPADHEQALAWFSAEHPVVLAAIHQAAEAGFDGQTWQLASTLTTFFDRRGHWRDLAATQRIAVVAAGRLGDRAGQANSHIGFARAQACLGQYEDAYVHLQHALDLYAALGDDTGQARTHHGLSVVAERLGRHAEALEHSRRALDLYRAVGDRAGQARALNAVGWSYAQLGEYRRALAYSEQALVVHQELGNRDGAAATWDSLGYAHHHLGDYPQAASCYGRALELCGELGDRHHEAEILAHLGDTRQAAGDLDAATGAWRRALDIFDALGHPDADKLRAKLADADRR